MGQELRLRSDVMRDSRNDPPKHSDLHEHRKQLWKNVRWFDETTYSLLKQEINIENYVSLRASDSSVLLNRPHKFLEGFKFFGGVHFQLIQLATFAFGGAA